MIAISLIYFYILLFHSLFESIVCIRTRNSWNELFSSNIYTKYSNDRNFQDKLELYHSLHRDGSDLTNYLYVLKYKKDCGQICHQFLTRKLLEIHPEEHHYEIVNSNHGVIRTSLRTIQSLHTTYSDLILDYVPFLPELKYDEYSLPDVLNCDRNTDVTLHVVFTVLKSDINITSLIKFGTLQDLQEEDDEAQQQKLQQLGKEDSENTFDETFTTPSKQIPYSILLPCSLLATTPLSTIIQYYSHLPVVHWIEIRSPMQTFTKFANSLTQIDSPDVSHNDNIYQLYRSKNLTGQNEIIGISDTGIDITSCFFYDPNHTVYYNVHNPKHRKIVYYRSYVDSIDSYGHGTAVAGIAAGECLHPLDHNLEKRRGQYNSVASKSKIAFFDISGIDNVLRIPSDINSHLLQTLYSTGAKVMSLSWGSTTTRYSIDSRNVDIFQYKYPDSLVIVAAGNSGLGGYNTLGTPANCKNGLTVGSSLNSGGSWKSMSQPKQSGYNKDSLSGFSSRGPTLDGRRKPDVCGVGEYLYHASARDPFESENVVVHGDMNYFRGTSFSTPLLAAHAVIIRQYFLAGYYPSGTPNLNHQCTPSGALMKALLIHSSRPLKRVVYDEEDRGLGYVEDTEFGDFLQGFGRVVLSDTLQFQDMEKEKKKKKDENEEEIKPFTSSLFIIGCNPTDKTILNMTKSMSYIGEVHQYEIVIDSVRTSEAPLKVTLAYTDMYPSLGSVIPLVNDLDLTLSNSSHIFYPYSPTAPNKQEIDRLNNVEVILLPNPISNTTYTLTITAFQLSTRQSYALVITGDIIYSNLMKRDLFVTASSSFLTDMPLKVKIIMFLFFASVFITTTYFIYEFISQYLQERKYRTQKTGEDLNSSDVLDVDIGAGSGDGAGVDPPPPAPSVGEGAGPAGPGTGAGPSLSLYSLRESNLRSFSERYDQFNELEFSQLSPRSAALAASSSLKGRKSSKTQFDSRASHSSNGSVSFGHDLPELYPTSPTNLNDSISPYFSSSRGQSSFTGASFDMKNKKTISKDLLFLYSLPSSGQRQSRSQSSQSPRQSPKHSPKHSTTTTNTNINTAATTMTTTGPRQSSSQRRSKKLPHSSSSTTPTSVPSSTVPFSAPIPAPSSPAPVSAPHPVPVPSSSPDPSVPVPASPPHPVPVPSTASPDPPPLSAPSPSSIHISSAVSITSTDAVQFQDT